MASINARSLDAVLDEIEARIGGASWGEDEDGNPLPAFHEVRRFSSDDILGAFKDLVAVQQRVCVVVLTGVAWESAQREQPLLFYQRTARVSLLCSDEVLSDETAALWGTQTNPGAWQLAELALQSVGGLLLANPAGVIVRPVEQTPMAVVDLQRRLPGRAVVAVEIEAVGGTLMEAISSRGPIA